MIKAWAIVAVLCVFALPGMASAQFGGGGGFGGGMTCVPPPEPKAVLEFDKDARQDFAPIAVLSAPDKAALAKVVEALDKTAELGAIQDIPLSELVIRLRESTGLRITIDERGLADASIGTDTLITLPGAGTSLRTVLDTVTSDHGMGWFPGRGGIVISTPEVRDVTMLTVIYPVADLVSSPDGDDYNSPIEVICTTIQPDSWKEGGTGEGTIAPYPAFGALIVSQPWHIHEQLPPFFQGLRDAKTQQGIRGLRKLPVAAPANANATSRSTPQAMTAGGFF